MDNLVSAMKKFKDMLDQYPDNNKSIYKFYSFLKTLPNIHSDNIPFIELGTILKHKKPVIFQGLKAFSDKSPIINLITSVDMDFQKAINKINQIIKNCS